MSFATPPRPTWWQRLIVAIERRHRRVTIAYTSTHHRPEETR